MSDMVFNTSLPGMQMEIQRSPHWITGIAMSAGQREVRTAWTNYPRYRWNIRCTYRTVEGEAAAIQSFVEAHLGEWDSFLLVDPYDGATKRVRFDGMPSFRQYAVGWWEGDINLISVVP